MDPAEFIEQLEAWDAPPPRRTRPVDVGPGPVTLAAKDYRPIAGYPFQRWGERTGRPFRDLRPLTGDAARRVWRQATLINGAEWDGSLPADRYPHQATFDLRGPAAAWDESTVRDWLAGQAADRARPVLACYGPEWVVELAWGDFCDFWLTFLWVDACAFPADEAWFLRYASEQFVFGRAG